MSRPHRPHPDSKPTGAAATEGALSTWKAGHPKQETAAERKARKRREAEERDARHRYAAAS